jgi:hypothetical protein
MMKIGVGTPLEKAGRRVAGHCRRLAAEFVTEPHASFA